MTIIPVYKLGSNYTSDVYNSGKWVDGKKQSALYVHWICVSRQFAGMGLPKLMINFAQLQAKKRKFSLLRLDTIAHETKLRTIYENLGFQLVGIDKKTAFYQKSIT